MTSFRVMVTSIGLSGIFGLVMVLMGHGVAGAAVSLFGTFLSLWVTLVYIALFDPMNRWPHRTPMQRIGLVFSFHRGDQ